MNKTNKLPKERVNLILSLYDKKENISQIQKETGHSPHAINRILNLHRGVELYPSQHRKKEEGKKKEEKKTVKISCVSSIKEALSYWEKMEKKARAFIVELTALLDLAQEAESKNTELNEIITAFTHEDEEKAKLKDSLASLQKTNADLQEKIKAILQAKATAIAYQNSTCGENSLNENKS